MPRRLLLLLVLLVLPLAWLAWSPGPDTDQRFDRGRNGLWIGHQWYTGRHVRTGEPIGDAEVDRLVERVRRGRIRYLYVHAGPIRPDGGVDDRPSSFFRRLERRLPDVVFLPWLGGLTPSLALDDPDWRAAFVQTVGELGFGGVHLDIEPIQDRQPGYVQLLRDLRAAFGPAFLLSHATRRAGPFGRAPGIVGRYAWSRGFYQETIALTDQTVLMAYDTTLDSRKHYVAFVRHQADLLLDWACHDPTHQVLVGLPTYDDVPISNPEVETISHAAAGVRAALERRHAPCFEGVAVYAEWTTDEREWAELEDTWLGVSHPLKSTVTATTDEPEEVSPHGTQELLRARGRRADAPRGDPP